MKTSYSILYQSLFMSPLHSASKIAILSSLVFGASAMAADGFDDDTPSFNLPKITVTATRTPTAINNTIAQTQVIDSETLKHYQGESVLEVIKHQPGFSFKQNGGLGTSGNFYMRGYDSKQILVLIDGVRYSSLSSGDVALSLLPADQIERIEVLYGASGSSIYGADAMGGVIQIFTKGGSVDASQFSVTTGVGSHDQYLYGATAQFRNEVGTSLSLSASHNETDGINATLAEPSNPYSVYNADDDGYDSDNYSLALNQQVNPNLKVGITGLYSESTTEYDNGASLGKDSTHAKQNNGAAQAYADWRYMPNASVKLSYGQSIDKSDNPSFSSHYDTKQQQINLSGDYNFPIGTAIYGIDYLKQELDSNQYQTDDRKVTSGFAGYVFSYDNVDAQANVRYDDYSDFDSETTYNLGAAFHLSPDLRIGANYAKGYRVPTFGNLYSPKAWGGNPHLNPEESDNYEAFIEYATPLQSTRLTGYRNDVEGLITSDGNATEDYPYGKMVNLNQAKIDGVNLTSDWFIDDYLFGLSYDYQEAKDDSGKDNDGHFLPTRPKNKGTAYVGYQLDDLNIRAEYQYVDDYYSRVANLESQRVDSYHLVNISGNYQLSPNLSLSARLNNVFNEKYVTEPNYNTDGTNFFTSLTYTFQ